MKKLFKILTYVKPYWPYASLNVFFNILAVIFSLASFAVFIPILNMLFKMQDIPEEAVPLDIFNFDSISENFNFYAGQLIKMHGEMETLLYIAFIILGLYFLKNLFRYLAMFFLAPIRNGVVRDLRNDMYKKVLILPISYFSEKKKGDIISRMTSDVLEIEWSIMSSLESVFREPIAIIASIAVLFFMSPSLTIFVMVLLPISGFLIGQIGKSLKRTSDKSQKSMGFILSVIEETIGGLRIIKGFTAINSTEKKFQAINQDYTKLMIKLYRKRDMASPLSEFMGVGVVVTILWYGGRLILSEDSTMEAAEFLVYLGIFSQILNPAKAITTAFYNIQKGAASVERVEGVLDAPEIIEEKPQAIAKKEFIDTIEYKDLSFSYQNHVEVLKKINLKIAKGKTIALVGASGGGKSTLADLLPRFYDPQEGSISIDGVDIKDIVIDDVRGLMGIVTQESILFNDTVFNNIALGIEDKVTLEEVKNAAKIANAHEFIEQMEEGYDSIIGDRGQKLSGGQRQRLSIARAVLKNPPIMILDEATSALDTESERLVQQALENLMKNRTSLIIAHRLSTIQHADEIIVVDKGEIVERGIHEELLKEKGIYHRLHDMQAFA
ncbi:MULTISPECIES: ABC transporter ATP-binding protein [unclassified Lentimicrobium]|uniref:ABC transporter ATP-binding protein n=1 Tax=unclassified Lentimicrobium TaxID=2677434 RepID=UPI001553FA92|nr:MULTISPECIES: ABC transporter ATP-binding protein [unclassified Lentimicrobium]NPD46283.1 ABC transporter ATP-binding protein [Lentimicrobium sp. S6]NPD83949.1 ABC transporter ATP-binding protein [Lentimicrobium sp. L6]